jgi:hypothetical protein
MSNEYLTISHRSDLGNAFPDRRRAGGRYSRNTRSRITALILLALICAALLAAAAGCGGDTPDTRPQEVQVAERALQVALGGERTEFVGLVAPSFLEQARAEMPDTDDETLGGVLIAGFLEGIPFTRMIEAQYSVGENNGDPSVYVWGSFVDADGAEVIIEEADAVRIPLVREDGRLYIDLLDL